MNTTLTHHRFVRKREPWLRFALKFVITGMLIVGTGYALASRFSIAYDPQIASCFYDHRVFLIDKRNNQLERGAIYAFSAKGLDPFFDDGTAMAKILVGLPGDEILITAEGVISVNGDVVGDGFMHSAALDMVPEDFAGRTTLAANTYWFMGETPESFDSRYWGTVKMEQIIGRAHPIF